MRKKGGQIVDALVVAATVLVEVIVEQGVRKTIEWISGRKRRRKQQE